MPILPRPEAGFPAALVNRHNLLAVTAGAVLLAGFASTAGAYPFSLQERATAPSRVTARTAMRPPKSAAAPKEDELAAKAKGILTVVVSLDKQQLTLYSDGHPIARSRVSTGVPGHPTPTGVFSIIQKDRWHHSNIYSNAPMYFMQRITWSGVALHQGVVPNGPASHGCIRMPDAFAKQMWGITKLGARVIVTRGDVTPMPVANDRLFAIKQPPQPVPPAPQPEIAGPAPTEGTQPAPASTEVNQPAPASTELNQPASNGASIAAVATAQMPKPTPVALNVLAYDDGGAATKGKRKKTAQETPPPAAEPRPLKPGPISVFVSRKEGKLFVRKGFDPVFSAAVTFEQPEKPLGTHVFTAVGVKDDNTTLSWTAMTMPAAVHSVKPVTKRGAKVAQVETPAPASSATEALERVTMPPEAVQAISELMSPGASLIISDQGLGPETGKGTDFIVLTR